MYEADHANERVRVVDPLGIRAAQRVAIDLPVRIDADGLCGHLFGRTRDLSSTGVCLSTPSPIDLKSVRQVQISLDNTTMVLPVVGLWTRDDAQEGSVLSGFAFDPLASAQKTALRDLVHERSRRVSRFLEDQTVLGDLGDEDLLGLASVTRMKTIPAGHFVHRQGETDPEGGSLYVIRRGQVTLQLRLRDRVEMPILKLSPGDILGGLPLIGEIGQPDSAVANDNLELFEIDSLAFRFLRINRPWLAHRLTSLLVRIHVERLANALDAAVHCR